MADAKKCDRCGRYYDVIKSNTLYSLNDLSLSLKALSERVGNKEKSIVDALQGFDLCESCKESLTKWFQKEREP